MDEVRRIRLERGLSQQHLAELANVNKVTLVHLETGKTSPNVETLEKLAAALGCEIADFFPKAEPPLPFHERATGEGRGLQPLVEIVRVVRVWCEDLAHDPEQLPSLPLVAKRSAKFLYDVFNVGFERYRELAAGGEPSAHNQPMLIHELAGLLRAKYELFETAERQEADPAKKGELVELKERTQDLQRLVGVG